MVFARGMSRQIRGINEQGQPKKVSLTILIALRIRKRKKLGFLGME